MGFGSYMSVTCAEVFSFGGNSVITVASIHGTRHKEVKNQAAGISLDKSSMKKIEM